MDRISAARDLLARGWTPVPVSRGAKKPYEDGWQQLTVTEDDLPRRFSGVGNIGVVTGALSNGLTDVDLDCDQTVMLTERFLPSTRMRSGHGPRRLSHWFYKITGQLPTSAVFKDIDGTTLVELRTDGHQTLVPPSIHPDGDPYEWEGELEPAECDGDDLLRRVARLAAAALLARHWPREKGSRHDIANALAGMLVRSGWSDDQVSDFVSAVAECAGDEEARARANAAVGTARRAADGRNTTGAPTLAKLVGDNVVTRLREWLGLRFASPNPSTGGWQPPVTFRKHSLPNFPVDCLPGWLSAFVVALATAKQTPAALAGGLVLAAVGITVARRVRIQVREGWSEPTNLFIATSMAPGNRKTAVSAEVNAPIVAFERNEAIRLAPEIRDAECRRRVIAKALKDAEKQAARAVLDGTSDGVEDVKRLQVELAGIVVPVKPRFFTDEVTPEALSQLIERHGGRFAVLSAEGGVFELMAGRYGNNGTPNFDVYLKGHAGDPLRVDRVTRGSEVVDLPALTIGLAFQPDVLRNLASKPGFRGRGLLGRFLYALPKSLLGNREIDAPAVPEAVRRRYEKNILTLLRDTPEPPDAAHPPCIRLEPAAHRVFMDLERWLEPRLAPDAQLGSVADWASKLAGAVARLAAIMHVAEAGDARKAVDTPISVSTITNAIELGEFYLAHALAAFAEMGADPEVERAKLVLSWLRRTDVTAFTARDAFQNLKHYLPKVSVLRESLDLLADHGFIRQMEATQRSGPGRRPSERFEVNPLWNRNSEEIEEIEEAIQESKIDEASSKDSSTAPLAAANWKSVPLPQFPHFPQNADDDPGGEVVL